MALDMAVERLGEKRQPAGLARVLLTILAMVLYAAAWTAGKAGLVVALVVACVRLAFDWAAAAMVVGWQDARRPRVEPGRVARR